MIVILLVTLVLFVLSMIASKNDLFAPVSITSAVWMFCVLLWWLLPHSLPPLSSQFIIALLIWLLSFSCSATLGNLVPAKRTEGLHSNRLVRDLYLLITLVTFVSFIIYVLQVIAVPSPHSWPTKLRLAAVYGLEGIQPYQGLSPIVWKVSLLIELFYLTKKYWYRLVLPLIANFSYAFFTMSKTHFLILFLIIISFLYYRYKNISITKILLATFVLFFVFVKMQSLRQGSDIGDNKNGFLVLYLLSSMSAFDTIDPCSSAHFAETVGLSFYSILFKLGLTSIPPSNPILPFIEEPIVTNTYTCMYPYFKDFGNWGIFIFGNIIGFIFGWIYKRKTEGFDFYNILYLYALYILVMQYVNEIFFTSLTGHVYFVILLLLAFIPTKFKIRKNIQES